MKKIHLLILLVLWGVTQALADRYAPYQLSIVNSQLQKNGDRLLVEFTVDYTSLVVPSNDQLIVSPVIVNRQDSLRLPFLLFPGKTRDKVNHRKIRLYGEEEHFPEPYAVLYPETGGTHQFTYRQEVPFADWMYGGQLELQQDVYGCADCHKILAALPLSYIANPPRVAFLVPVASNNREENVNLYIHFPWDQAVILPDFRDNRAELEKIDRSMQRVLRGRPGRMQRVALTGYASPEGSYPYNTRLAGRRVQAVKDYIQRQYPVGEVLVVTDTVPEDWQGVRRWAQASDLKYKDDVIDIIDRTPNPDARDNRLRRLDKSATYHRLLREAYPPLRRVVYQVNYEVDPLTNAEVDRLYRSHPEQLSPAELYQLADSYQAGTPEFNEIVFATVRLYPKDPAANNNAAAVALQQQDIDQARVYLLQAGNNAQTENNRGVLLMLEGRMPEAIECFKQACAHGCHEAILNLHNLERAEHVQ